MEKKIRRAVRTFILRGDEVVATKYKEGTLTPGYYDTVGGKIEDGETAEMAAIREAKEESGLDIKNLIYRGKMVIEFPERIFDFETFVCYDYEGEVGDFEENEAMWMKIDDLLKQEKLFPNTILLDRFFISSLLSDSGEIKLHVYVKDNDTIKKIEFEY